MITKNDMEVWMNRWEEDGSMTLKFEMAEGDVYYLSGDYKDVVMVRGDDEITIITDIEFWELDDNYLSLIQPVGMADLTIRFYLPDIESISVDYCGEDWED